MSIAWFIYLAGLMGDVKGWFVFLTVVSTLVSIGLVVAYAINLDYPRNEPAAAACAKWFKRIVWVPFLASFIACLVPTSDTLYMIAGVSVAKDVVQTPEFQKTRQLLDTYLDDALKGKK